MESTKTSRSEADAGNARAVSRLAGTRLRLLITPVLLLWFPLFEVFSTLSLPFFERQSMVILGGVAAFGLALGTLLALLLPHPHSGRLRQFLFVGTMSTVVLAAVDVAAGGHRVLDAATIAGSAPAVRALVRIGTLVGAFSLVSWLLWKMRQRAATLLFIIALVAFVSTLAVNVKPLQAVAEAPSRPPPARSSGPPLVYIVVDEAMGVGGFRAAPGGEATASAMQSLFERHGFRVYDQAFSRHFVSARAIPNTLNFDLADNSYGPILRHHEKLKVRSAMFERYARNGYEIVSYGTEHIDFCFKPASRCEALPSFNPFSRYITNDDMRDAALLQVVRQALPQSYIVYNYTGFLSSYYDRNLPSAYSTFDAWAFPRWFDQFADDVAASPRGRAYFAHILMPHSPMVLDQMCRETGAATVGYFLTEKHNLRGAALDNERAQHYRRYYGQSGCLLRKLDSLLTRLEQAPAFKDATIVIHGDHGSRISAGQYVETISRRDMVDNYSALYAIKAPHITPGIDRRKTSVQRLTAEFFSGRTAQQLGPDVPTVVIDSKNEGTVVVKAMPDFEQNPRSGTRTSGL